MTPFYQRLPDVAGFGVERSADLIGLSLTVGAAAGVAAHAVATGVHRARRGERPDKPATELPVVPAPKQTSEEDSNG